MLVLALDRAPQNREIDKFGRLHVRLSNVCKAAVNPYRGAEIPGHEALGLDPDRVYQLLRDPEEIAKAASTSNNIQILQIHIPVTADQPQKEEVVGSTGTDAEWNAPYLTNSLVVWDKEAIAGIDSEEVEELSPGYAYEADMTSGEFEGLHYDGIMRNIVFNHVALVSKGRQGPDIVVGDAEPEFSSMPKAALKSRKAILVYGGLTSALLPLLAADAAIDLRPVVADVTAKGFKGQRPALKLAVAKLVAGKLAQDADLDSVLDKVLDRLDSTDAANEGDAEEDDALQPAVDDGEEDPVAKLLAYCKGKMGEDDFAELAKLAGGEGMDSPSDGEGGDGPGVPGANPKPVSDPASRSQAMDAAFEQRIMRRVTDAAAARVLVEPVVGKVSLALDSADAIYDFALEHLGIDAKGVNTVGKRALLENRAKPAESRMAMDHAGAADAEANFRKAFPNASNLRGRR